MKHALFSILLLLGSSRLPAQAPSEAGQNTCIDCHTVLGGEFSAPVKAVAGSIHSQPGLSCAGCHGGDPTQMDPEKAMDPRKGFVGRPAPQAIPHFCGKCHSDTVFMRRYNPSPRVDQVTEYYTSIHGKRLKQGDTKVATCIKCHGYHDIKAVSDPESSVYPLNVADTCGKCHANASYMKPYTIPTDQLEQYTKSVHAEALEKKQDLSAPTCNDCHGNHGAVPPGVESVAEVCGTCHVRQAGLFEKSPHQPAFKAMQLASCVTCHGNHYIPYATDAMLGVGQNAVCIRCHTQGEPGYQAAQKMRAMIDRLSGRINQANQILETASSAGMEVSHPEFELTDAKGKLINARVVVHSFSPTQLQAAVDPGIKIANNAYEAGQAAMREHHVRRVGLAASLVVIFFAVLAIYFKVRQIEGREQ